MSRPDPRDHALRTLLEDELGGDAVPDLTERILQRAADGRAAEPDELDDTMTDTTHDSFATITSDPGASRGVFGEFMGFMAENSKWWLVPFLLVFALLGFLTLLGSTGAAPFIYTLF